MLNPLKKTVAFLDRLALRLRKSRPGSVLILVVALLVLMALIGTAYLSLTTSERYASVQNVYNTQVEVLADGVKQVIASLLVDGTLGAPTPGWNASTAYVVGQTCTGSDGNVYHALTPGSLINPVLDTAHTSWGIGGLATPALTWNNAVAYSVGQVVTGSDGNPYQCLVASTANNPVGDSTGHWTLTYKLYRPAPDSTTAYSYHHWDSPIDSPFLGDRDLVTLTDAFNNGADPLGTSTPRWGYISKPVPTISSNGQFESPWNPSGSLGSPSPFNYSYSTKAYPTYINVTNTLGQATRYPAFTFYGDPTGSTYLAADASGGGIADCGLMRLPMGQVNGVQFYAGFHIVDNGGMINLNTAWTANNDYAIMPYPISSNPTPIPSTWYFRSNIGLQELLNPATNSGQAYLGGNPYSYYEMWNLMAWRTDLSNLGLPTTFSTTAWPNVENQAIFDQFDGYTPIDRYDFSFTSQGQVLDDQVARRVNLPGPMMANPGNNIGSGGLVFANAWFTIANWSPSTGYIVGNSVIRNGVYYYSSLTGGTVSPGTNVGHDPATDTTNWAVQNIPNGNNGAGTKYTAGTYYSMNNVCWENNMFYQSTINNNLNDPASGSGWTWQEYNIPLDTFFHTYTLSNSATLSSHDGIVHDATTQSPLENAAAISSKTLP